MTSEAKALDAAHFDLLKDAYDLQGENIAQLKENNGLLQDRVRRLERENESLRESVEDFKQRVPSASGPSDLSSLSGVARDVLKL